MENKFDNDVSLKLKELEAKLETSMKSDIDSCSTAVDTQSFKTLASQGVQLSTHNGVVPTKSGGISDGFYLFGRSYF